MSRVDEQQGGMMPGFMMPDLVTAAHELKSPLALIRQLALSLEAGELDAADIARLAHRMELTSDRALRLVEDLTRSARLDDGLFALEPVNPVALCDEVVHEISPLYHAHERSIQAVSRRHSPLVVADRSLLRRVLLGFADNALHYGDESETVQLQTSQHGDTVRISVRDFGPGLTTQLWRSIRHGTITPQAISRRPASSGLGLAISSQFAHAMNGQVGVVRHRDGTSFYIELAGSTQTSWL